MINQNELRIGNHITDVWASPGCTFEVISFDTRIVKYGAKFACKWKDAMPIPLTPEILAKCGFSEGMLAFKGFYYRDLVTGPTILVGLDGVNDVRVTNQLGNSVLIAANVTTLHRIQNIWQALTLTELTFTP